MLISECFKEFISDRKCRNLSPLSIKKYEMTLKLFGDFCMKNQIVDIEDVTVLTLKSFMIYLQDERNNNPTSRNSHLRTLKSLFNYLEEIEVISEKQNAGRKLQYAKEEVIIEPMTMEQINKLIGYLQRKRQREKSFTSRRNYLMIITLLGTGIRLQEMLNLKWSDVNLDDGYAKIFGKKRETSTIPITDKLASELAQYKVYINGKFTNPNHIFTTNTNKQLQPDSVKSIFSRLRKVLNFQVNAHLFRHTFAVMNLKNGLDSLHLQRLLNHSTLAMTNRYVRMFGNMLRDEATKTSPLNDLDI